MELSQEVTAPLKYSKKKISSLQQRLLLQMPIALSDW